MPGVVTPSEQPPDRHAAIGHSCVDYPITFYIASKSHNSGSVVAPRIIASSCVFFGQGHPLNRTEILMPESEGYMPLEATSGPRLSIISRRSLLRGLLQALVSVKDIYRVGRAATCLHINVSSQYLDLVWNKWLPDWETNGWPSKEDEGASLFEKREGSISTRKSKTKSIQSLQTRERANSRASTRMSVRSRADSITSGMTGDAQLIFDDDSNRLINEDLLRKISVFRRNFFTNTEVSTKGAAYVQMISYRHNPADRLAKESVNAASLDLTTQLPRPKSFLPSTNASKTGESSVFSTESDNSRPSSVRGANRSKASTFLNQTSPRKGTGQTLSSLQESGEQQQAFTAPQENHKVAASARSAPRATKASSNGVAVAAAPVKLAVVGISAPAREAVQKPKMLSRDNASGYGTDTDIDEFNDAASTFSDEDKEPQSALSKIIGIPTAVVAATVSAVMAPSTETEIKETLAPTKTDSAANRRGSFAVETEKALAAVKGSEGASPRKGVVVPGRNSSYGRPAGLQNMLGNGAQKESLVQKRKSGEVKRDSTVKSARSGDITQKTTGKVRQGSAGEVIRKPSVKDRKSAEITRESSRVSRRSDKSRSRTPLSLAESNNLARQLSTRSATKRPKIEPSTVEPIVATTTQHRPTTPPSPSPPKAKQRNSFFSLRGINKKTEGYFKSNKSSEPYLPPMDRLVDYRPPQGRNLRSNQFSRPLEEENQEVTSPLLSPNEEKRPEKVESQTTKRGGPFAFFKKRASVKGVF